MIGANLAVIFVVFMTLFVSISYFMEHYFHRAKQRELMTNATKLAERLSHYPYLVDNVAAGAVVTTFQQFTGTAVWIGDETGALITPIPQLDLWGEGTQIDPATILEASNSLEGDEEPLSYRTIHPETGQPFLSVALPIGYGTDQTAVLHMHTPLVGVRTTIRAVRRLLLSAGLISVIAAAFVSYFATSRIAGPLAKMQRAAQTIAGGDLRARVDVPSDDEVGRLGESFNMMATRLQEMLDEQARVEKWRREFFADVAHELRTPLTSIRGFLEAIADGVPQTREEQDEYVRIAAEETRRLQRLSDTLLHVSRIDAGGEPFTPAKVSVVPVIAGAIEKVTPQAVARSVRVVLDADESLPPVNADEDKVDRILLNLLDNALHYTPPGGRVVVKAVPLGNEIQIAVQDTGPGIPPAEQPFVWERFYKVDKARHGTAGSGLGLVIVRQLVEMHGGTVSLGGGQGEGADFRFTLPVYNLPADSKA